MSPDTGHAGSARLPLLAACLLLLFLIFVAAIRPRETASREVAVAAAADLQFALADLVRTFEEEHPTITLRVTRGSSGTLYAQIANRAPFDVFLSADGDLPGRLVEQGLASPRDSFPYAQGRLAIWAPEGSPLEVGSRGPDALTDPRVRHVAIANPEHAPYGRAAEAALRHLGLYDAVASKLVFGENVLQAAQFVEAGSAEVGIIALSLARAPPLAAGACWEVPPDAHPPLEQRGVVLRWARDRDAANAFRDLVTGPAGRAILHRYGFVLPGE